ncbi:MAG: hypothetical protein ACFB0C_15625 [Leptolyngbyaceae cyanobacterium]
MSVSPVGLIFPHTGTPLAELVSSFSMEGYANGTLTAKLWCSAEAIITNGDFRFNLAWRDAGTGTVTALDSANYASPQASATFSRGGTPSVFQFPAITFSDAQIDGVTTGEAQLLLSRDNTIASNATGIIYVHKVELSEA